jgi:hypothetical protein
VTEGRNAGRAGKREIHSLARRAGKREIHSLARRVGKDRPPQKDRVVLGEVSPSWDSAPNTTLSDRERGASSRHPASDREEGSGNF